MCCGREGASRGAGVSTGASVSLMPPLPPGYKWKSQAPSGNQKIHGEVQQVDLEEDLRRLVVSLLAVLEFPEGEGHGGFEILGHRSRVSPDGGHMMGHEGCGQMAAEFKPQTEHRGPYGMHVQAKNGKSSQAKSEQER